MTLRPYQLQRGFPTVNAWIGCSLYCGTPSCSTCRRSWTRGGVANLHACEAPELARYFILGLNVGSKPLFDGICAQCAVPSTRALAAVGLAFEQARRSALGSGRPYSRRRISATAILASLQCRTLRSRGACMVCARSRYESTLSETRCRQALDATTAPQLFKRATTAVGFTVSTARKDISQVLVSVL